MAKSRAELMQYAQREYAEVEGVRLQSLTELELSDLRAIWGKRYAKDKDIDMVMRRELLVRTIVDDSGERIFANSETDVLAGWRSQVTETLHEAARKLCGLDVSESVAEAEKKSGTATAIA